MNVIEKLRLLEQYILSDKSTADQIIYITIDKLLSREQKRTKELKKRLEDQIDDFEKRYSMNTSEFYSDFKDGKMGDDIDFIEWAATYEMINNVINKLNILDKGLECE